MDVNQLETILVILTPIAFVFFLFALSYLSDAIKEF